MTLKEQVVAIHQPNFLPWLGFFHKIYQSDIFILLDNVPFTKSGYQNRVKIKSAQGEQWLTVPVLTKGRFGQLTSQVPINANTHWGKAHTATLRTNYQRAPYYEEIYGWLEPLYRKAQPHLAAFNLSLIEAILRYLKLSANLIMASSLVFEGNGPELLLQLVQLADGQVYLSGPSGRDYLDTSIFELAGIKIEFQQFYHPIYPQLYGDFMPGLSILDALMNIGPVQTMHLLQRNVCPDQNAIMAPDPNLLCQTQSEPTVGV